MKYKVGDNVRVRIDLVPHKVYGSLTFLDGNMSKCAGQICTITAVLSDKKYYVSENPFAWSEEMLEPADSMTLRMADGTVIGEFNTGGLVSIHDVATHELWTTPFIIPNDRLDALVDAWAKLGCTTFNLLSDEVKEVIKKTEEKKVPTKFTFYTIEGYRMDKSNNAKIPTVTTEVVYKDKDGCATGGSATCDKADYDSRQGVLEALANMCCGGNFDREYNKAVKDNARADKISRTCTYCGQLFDTVAEKEAHEAWHVERRKARHERYLLRKRAKEIAFEEAAQKMAKEIIAEDKKK